MIEWLTELIDCWWWLIAGARCRCHSKSSAEYSQRPSAQVTTVHCVQATNRKNPCHGNHLCLNVCIHSLSGELFVTTSNFVCLVSTLSVCLCLSLPFWLSVICLSDLTVCLFFWICLFLCLTFFVSVSVALYLSLSFSVYVCLAVPAFLSLAPCLCISHSLFVCLWLHLLSFCSSLSSYVLLLFFLEVEIIQLEFFTLY